MKSTAPQKPTGKLSAWIAGGLLAGTLFAFFGALPGIIIGALIFLIIVVRLADRVSFLRFGTATGIGLAWIAACLIAGGALGIGVRSSYAAMQTESARADAEMAALREADPAAYLGRLKATRSDSEWMGELRALDPAAFQIETAKRAEAEKGRRETAVAREASSSGGSNYRSTEWYAGGTLHNATGASWRMSSAQNRLATAGDFVSTFMGEARVLALGSMDRLKPFATSLQVCIDEATATPAADNLAVRELAAACAILIDL